MPKGAENAVLCGKIDESNLLFRDAERNEKERKAAWEK